MLEITMPCHTDVVLAACQVRCRHFTGKIAEPGLKLDQVAERDHRVFSCDHLAEECVACFEVDAASSGSRDRASAAAIQNRMSILSLVLVKRSVLVPLAHIASAIRAVCVAKVIDVKFTIPDQVC